MSFVYEALREQMLQMEAVQTIERQEWERERDAEQEEVVRATHEEMMRVLFEDWEEEKEEERREEQAD
jgi:hypothetical protein